MSTKIDDGEVNHNALPIVLPPCFCTARQTGFFGQARMAVGAGRQHWPGIVLPDQRSLCSSAGMMARSHVVVGVTAWIIAAPLLHLSQFHPLYLGLTVAGSLLPDVDHPQSWVGRRSRPISTVLAATFGHRGVTHSAIAVLGLTVLLARAGYRRGEVSALAIGYLSHLAADLLTPRGLRLAWPHRRTWGFPLCRTGSPVESMIVLALVGFLAYRLLSAEHFRIVVLPS